MTMVNASGFGTSVAIKASVTFPQGITLKHFADDADSLDMPELTAADSAMGINGTHVVWSKPTVMELVLNIVPNSVDDINLTTLFDANRLAENKASAADEITLVITYPDGSTITLGQGIVWTGMPVKGVSQAGRLKSRQFKYRFTTISKTVAA